MARNIESPNKIIIVDDKIENLNLLSEILSQQNYKVRRAISGSLALAAIPAFKPDLILLDITMPEMDGYEVCRKLKANPETAEIPIIFISALNGGLDKVKAFSMGGVDYITKPFDVSEVLARVENHLELRAAQAEVLLLNQQLEQHVQERTAELQKAKAQLHHKAFHDALTDLPNRAFLLSELAQAVDRLQKDARHRCALLFLDCDRFQVVNDSLGHAIGDRLLLAIMQRLQKLPLPDALIVRPGGDEFMILLRQTATQEQAEQIAQTIQQTFLKPFCIDGHELYMGVSIGIVVVNSTYSHPEDILRDSDTAMYRAKDLGKPGFQTFHPKMHERALRRLQLEHEMRRAIREDQFSLVYQPIMAMDNLTVAGFEALIRWYHPSQGFISPDDFIPIAEETGLVIPIGLWVLKEACRQAKQWQCLAASPKAGSKLGQNPLKMSVNLSVKQFSDPHLIEALDEILANTQLDSRCLKLEITETALMENADSAKALLEALKARQIELAIDDFGTGYSSLSYLHRFPVDTLKIDRFFINPPTVLASDQAMNEDHGHEDDLRIVKAAIALAHEFGMDVVAEGIETNVVVERLQAMGCDYGQGYYFSRPLSAEAMTEWLSLEEIAA